MNKTMLALAVGVAFLAPGVSLGAPKVYGKFNVGFDSQEDEIGLDFETIDRTWKLRDNNNSSRLGVKGDEELGTSGLKIIYQLEYGIDPDGDESSAFSERNIFVGMEGGFGQLRVGKYDTLIKEAGANVDEFNDTIGDITNLMVGETRNKNLVTYTTPTLAELVTFAVAVQPGEGRTATDDVADVEDGVADTFYASLTFEADAFNAALAYADNEAGGLKFDGTTAGVDILRATTQYQWSGFEVGALYQLAEGVDQTGGAVTGGEFEESTWLLSGGYSAGSWKVKGQYGETDGDRSDITRSELGIGVDYTLTKSATAQAYYVTYEDEDRVIDGISGPQTDTFGVAFVYSF